MDKPIANILIEPYVFRGDEKAPETGETWAVFIVIPERWVTNTPNCNVFSLPYHIELIRRPGTYWRNRESAINIAKTALDNMGYAFGEVL